MSKQRQKTKIVFVKYQLVMNKIYIFNNHKFKV